MKKQGFRCSQKIGSDGADVLSSGRVFQAQGPAAVKVLLPTVEGRRVRSDDIVFPG